MAYTIGVVLVNAFVYLGLTLLSHSLSAHDYGTLIYQCSLASTLAFLFLCGRTELELREIAVKKRAIQLAPLIFSICAFVLALCLWSRIRGDVEPRFLFFCLPLGAVLMIGEYLSVVLRTTGHYKMLALLGRPLNVFYLVTASAVLISGLPQRRFSAVASVILLSYGILAAFVLSRTRLAPLIWNSVVDKRSFPFWLSGLLYLLNMQAGALLLGHYGQLKEVGEYSLALLVVSTSSMVFSSYFAVYSLTKFYERWSISDEQGFRFVLLSILRATLLGFAIALIGAVAIYQVYPFIFDLQKYTALHSLSLLMLVAVVVRSLQSSIGMFMGLETTVGRKNAISLIAYILGIGLAWLLLPTYGVFGVAFGMIVAELVLLLGFAIVFISEAKRRKIDVVDLAILTFYEQFGQVYGHIRKITLRFNKRRVAIVGYYGFGNYGDDLFVLATYQRLLALGYTDEHNFKLTFICPSVGSIPEKHFAVLANKYPSLYRRDSLSGRAFRFLVKASVLISAEKIVYVGGSLFSGPSRSRTYLERALHHAGIRFYAIGVSVGPFPDNAARVSVLEHLKLFSGIVVRDKRSHELLQSVNVQATHSPDIVMGLDFPEFDARPVKARTTKQILVIPVELGGVAGKQQEEFYTTLCAEAATHGLSVSYGFLQIGEAELSKASFKGRGNSLSYEGQAEKFTNVLRQFDYVFTSRLHGAIVAFASGVPFYLFRHHGKCTDFLQDSDWPHFNKLSPSELLAKLEEVVAAPNIVTSMDGYRAAVHTRVDEMLKKIFESAASEVEVCLVTLVNEHVK